MAEEPRITVLLGSGFSQALGIQGTDAIEKTIDAALSSDPLASPYASLRSRLIGRFGKKYNFEVLMAALEACFPYGVASLVPKAPPYYSVFPEISTLCSDITPDIAACLYEAAIGIVLTQVSVDWTATIPRADYGLIQDFFNRLSSQFRLDIATLNYDQGLENFLTDAVDGFGGTGPHQQFDSTVFLADDTSPRVAHLHGSIAYGITEAPKNLVKNAAPPAQPPLALWTPRQDGSLWTALVVGADKPNKLVLPPYSIYFAWLAGALLRSPKLLVVGYGIGDVHVNAWLVNAARHHVGTDYRMVIVDRFDNEPPQNVLELFAYAAGFENGPQNEPALENLAFDDNIAVHAGAMLVRQGMPLTCSQITRVVEFLR